MSVEDIEASEQDNSAREIIDIFYGVTTLRITTATRDIRQGGNTYKATAAARTAVPQAPLNDDDVALELTLPINHAFVRRYVQHFTPPQRVSVRVRKLYESGDLETIWLGYITSMAVDDENTEATFRVPARGNDAAQRLLPVISVGRTCPYILYGPGCNVSRSASVGGVAHKVSTTVVSVNGREVRVDLQSFDRLDGWSEGGELVVTSGTASGERMSIREQADTGSTLVLLTLFQVIPGLRAGDSVDVYAGCAHTIDVCLGKFDNKDNFGGEPSLPDKNPWWNR